jgi:hypothetical protein
MDWPPHPDDEWIDVTGFGTPPQYVLGRSGAEDEYARARERYVTGQSTIEDFEAALDELLAPKLSAN